MRVSVSFLLFPTAQALMLEEQSVYLSQDLGDAVAALERLVLHQHLPSALYSFWFFFLLSPLPHTPAPSQYPCILSGCA